MREMTYLEQINEIVYKLPREVLEDINKRIGDWLASGGNENDPYIEQQLRFAKHFIQMKGESKMDKFTRYLEMLLENKRVVIEKEDVKEVESRIEGFLTSNKYTYSSSENMAGRVLIIIH